MDEVSCQPCTTLKSLGTKVSGYVFPKSTAMRGKIPVAKNIPCRSSYLFFPNHNPVCDVTNMDTTENILDLVERPTSHRSIDNTNNAACLRPR